jgi:hypothetical protein
MEPEDGLRGHVYGCGQVVPAADMTQFMGQNGIQLALVEPFADADITGTRIRRPTNPPRPLPDNHGSQRLPSPRPARQLRTT